MVESRDPRSGHSSKHAHMATYSTVEAADWLKEKTGAEVKHCLLNNVQRPVVLRGWIDSWTTARAWSPAEICRRLGEKCSTFKVCPKRETDIFRQRFGRKEAVVFETQCEYVQATFSDFAEWLERVQTPTAGHEEERAEEREVRGESSSSSSRTDTLREEDSTASLDCPQPKRKRLDACPAAGPSSPPSNPLLLYPPSTHWVYADYKYMCQLCHDHPELIKAIDWSVFGFEGRDGRDSTLWVGSEGACTPCHYDTYGCNLVAQLWGQKQWLLFPPSESHRLHPTRVPYEESSVFSEVNVSCPDLKCFPDFASATGHQVILGPGDVLFVPKHWWHYVQCTEPAVSVNTWIDLPSDSYDKVQEAVVRTIVGGLVHGDSDGEDGWINPNEEVFSHSNNLQLLSMMLAEHRQHKGHAHSSPLTPRQWAKVLMSRSVVQTVTEELLQADSSKT